MNKQWEDAKKYAGDLVASDMNLLLSKAQDYSTNNIHAVGAKGVASRMVDKVYRLQNLLETGNDPAVAESIEDTLSDVRNYATILAMLRNGKWPRMVKSVYIAGPIDNSESGFSKSELLEVLRSKSIAAFIPHYAYNGAHSCPEMVASVNRSAIKACDAVLVYWPEKDVSLGTGRDIEFAKMNGIPVYIVAPWCKSTELHDLIVCSTIADLMRKIAP